jgi:organic hydroperoxide reductase OsmC/OhrA
MTEIPMHYTTAYAWQGKAADGVVSIEGHDGLPAGTPHDTDRFSPEHLLVATAEICLANYVLLIADRSKLKVNAYSSTAEGELEFEQSAGYRFKRIVIRPQLGVEAGAESLAQRVVEKAHKACLVARSLSCPVDIEPTISS